MKKIISMLLVVVMCLVLVACDGKSTDKTQTIEITLENWQEFFEIKFIADFIKNPFGDITSVESGMRICLKSEYFDRLESATVHFDLKATNGPDDIYNYDLNTGNVNIEIVNSDHGIPYAFYGFGSSVCTYQYDSTHTADNVIIQIAPLFLGLDNNLNAGTPESNVHVVQISDSVATWIARKWETIEVSRVLGTITLIQK